MINMSTSHNLDILIELLSYQDGKLEPLVNGWLCPRLQHCGGIYGSSYSNFLGKLQVAEMA